jgi:hypothetical protein
VFATRLSHSRFTDACLFGQPHLIRQGFGLHFLHHPDTVHLDGLLAGGKEGQIFFSH